MGNLREDRWQKSAFIRWKRLFNDLVIAAIQFAITLAEKPVFLKAAAGFHMIVMTVQFAGLFPAILANIWTLDVHYTTIFLLDWSTESPKIQINKNSLIYVCKILKLKRYLVNYHL